MRKIFKTITAALLCCIFLIPNAEASKAIKINDLIEQSQAMDGKTVTVEGEAIGELMIRGNYSWVNLSDTTNAIGVWVKTEDAKKITFFGDYKHKGDSIQITGVFSRSCGEHGGDVDIHCSRFSIISTGSYTAEIFSMKKVISALILLVITVFCAAAFAWFRKRFPANSRSH